METAHHTKCTKTQKKCWGLGGQTFSLTIPCAICQEKDIMSCGVKESSPPCSSSFKDCALLILMSALQSAFEKATLTSPMSFM